MSIIVSISQVLLPSLGAELSMSNTRPPTPANNCISLISEHPKQLLSSVWFGAEVISTRVSVVCLTPLGWLETPSTSLFLLWFLLAEMWTLEGFSNALSGSPRLGNFNVSTSSQEFCAVTPEGPLLRIESCILNRSTIECHFRSSSYGESVQSPNGRKSIMAVVSLLLTGC